MTTVLAVDLGSASGRVLAGTLHDGRLDVTDIHRFKHEARRREDGTLTWDVATMEAETITGLKKALEQFPDARAVSIDTWGVDWAPWMRTANLLAMSSPTATSAPPAPLTLSAIASATASSLT